MGIGDKLSAFISSLLIPIFGIIICMFIYWPLALVLSIWIPLGVFIISWLSKVNITFSILFKINLSSDSKSIAASLRLFLFQI